jgi:hypothetical protein
LLLDARSLSAVIFCCSLSRCLCRVLTASSRLSYSLSACYSSVGVVVLARKIKILVFVIILFRVKTHYISAKFVFQSSSKTRIQGAELKK